MNFQGEKKFKEAKQIQGEFKEISEKKNEIQGVFQELLKLQESAGTL